jgi:hypothetical protein
MPLPITTTSVSIVSLPRVCLLGGACSNDRYISWCYGATLERQPLQLHQREHTHKQSLSNARRCQGKDPPLLRLPGLGMACTASQIAFVCAVASCVCSGCCSVCET